MWLDSPTLVVMTQQRKLRVRERLGKYRIDGRLAEGGFAVVYGGYDTIEGVPVALKVPHQRVLTPEAMKELKREVQLSARLEHPNILPIKNAAVIDGLFVAVYPLGDGTLADRLRRRLSPAVALSFTEQILEAVAHAHEHRIIHCDLKPENLILFPDSRLRLADFGIAKVALHTRTLYASGAGTVGYIAPEQALGKPSFRSDVFSTGLIIYRMFAGKLPEWPYEWPLPGHERLRQVVRPEFVTLLRRSLDVDYRKRFRDAGQMAEAFRRIKRRALKAPGTAKKTARSGNTIVPGPSWRTVRWREFQRRYRGVFATTASCERCAGPLGERMAFCPWCAHEVRFYRGPTKFPCRCGRCGRGMKKDWRYCASCYGPGVEEPSERAYTDKRYVAKCENRSCKRRDLMAFTRYCTFCRTKVKKPWKPPEADRRCKRCRWGVLGEYWDYCPWCGLPQGKKKP